MIDEVSSRITVIVRTYNSAEFIEDAISSALEQTLSRNISEIIVVDDGSTDDTARILERFGDHIRLIRTTHIGPIAAANLGIAESNGEFIILLDSDDQFEPSILERLLSAADRNQSDYVYCDYYERPVDGSRKSIVSLKADIFRSVASGILLRKSSVQELGGYDEHLLLPEYDLLIKLRNKGLKGTHVPLPLFTYNRRRTSLTATPGYIDRGIKQLSDKYGTIRGLRKY